MVSIAEEKKIKKLAEQQYYKYFVKCGIDKQMARTMAKVHVEYNIDLYKNDNE